MLVMRFRPGDSPLLLPVGELAKASPDTLWLDVERTDADWHERIAFLLEEPLHDHHLRDTLNENHPPYYDGTDTYDLLVFRALATGFSPEMPTTCSIAFVITDRLVISIRPPDHPVFDTLRSRLLTAKRKAPSDTAMLLYLLLNEIVNDLLAHRDVMTEVITQWQNRLLDREDLFSDWQELMRLRGELRRLEVESESQLDAIDEWRLQTGLVLDDSLAIRYNDLQEHVRRIFNHAGVLQHDIDSLVQIYFSANTQRTNDVLQFLAIISAVFLPLNLIAGVFGMNFSYLPMLRTWYGPVIISGLMILVVLLLLIWFRRQRWI